MLIRAASNFTVLGLTQSGLESTAFKAITLTIKPLMRSFEFDNKYQYKRPLIKRDTENDE
jgi:hypothetical protein